MLLIGWQHRENPGHGACMGKETLKHVTGESRSWAFHPQDIVWVCPALPGMIADVKIWDKYGPQCTKGCFMVFEVGTHIRCKREDCVPTSFSSATRH